MRTCIIILLAALFFSSCNRTDLRSARIKQDDTTWTGRIYTDFNELPGLEAYDMNSWAVLDIGDSNSISINDISKGHDHILLLEQVIRRPGSVPLQFRLYDTLHINNLQDSLLQIGYNSCYRGKTPAPDVVGVFRYSKNDYMATTLKAWRIDTRSMKFLPADTAGIKYLDYGGGSDEDDEDE